MFFMACFLSLVVTVPQSMSTTASKVIPMPGFSEMWREIQRLRSLVNQETDLRLAFEKNFIANLDQLRNMKSSIVNASISALQPTVDTVNTFQKRLSAVESETKTSKQEISKGSSEIEAMKQAISRLTRLGCYSGSEKVFYQGEKSPWNHQMNITFPTKFDRVPALALGMTMLDSNKDTNVRAHTYASNLTTTGFTLTLRTWDKTHQYGLMTNWMACPKKH